MLLIFCIVYIMLVAGGISLTDPFCFGTTIYPDQLYQDAWYSGGTLICNHGIFEYQSARLV